MIHEKMVKAFNDQINEELFSAYLYMAMAAWFEAKNLTGFAQWMKVQAQEEMGHALIFYAHINERGGTAKLAPIAGPDFAWESPLAAFQAAYTHEQHITARINLLADLAEKLKDRASLSFLQWFIDEQVEEEAAADQIVQRLLLAGDKGPGLFMIDKDLAARVFTPPPAVTAALQ